MSMARRTDEDSTAYGKEVQHCRRHFVRCSYAIYRFVSVNQSGLTMRAEHAPISFEKEPEHEGCNCDE